MRKFYINYFVWTPRYRYTLDELAMMLAAVKARAECYDQWADKVKAALEAKGDDRLDFSELKDLLEEANERKYPPTDMLEALNLTVEEAEKCQTVANQLGSKKVNCFFIWPKAFFAQSVPQAARLSIFLWENQFQCPSVRDLN